MCARKRRRAWFLALALIGAIGASWLAWRHHGRETSYQGKSLNHWLEQAMTAEDANERLAAGEAIKKIGTDGLPELVQMIGARDSGFKQSVMALADQQKLIKTDFVPALVLHQRALAGFSILRSEARPAVPALAQLLKKTGDQLDAAVALAYIDPEGITALVLAATNSNAEVRYLAAAGLLSLLLDDRERKISGLEAISIEHHGAMALPSLLALLKDEHIPTRRQAASALGHCVRYPDVAVPALQAALRDPNNAHDALVLQAAVVALGRFGRNAEVAAPLLTSALTNDSPMVRVGASNALMRIKAAAINKGITD